MIAMALVIRDKLYYREIEQQETIYIETEDIFGEMAYGLNKNLRIIWRDDYAEIYVSLKDTTEKNKFPPTSDSEIFRAPKGEITVIDSQNKIAVLFMPVSQSDKQVYFDNNDRINLGRTEKKAKDGSENTIIIKMPFVSSRHMEIISQNGKVFVRDNGSLNGIFVNGEKVAEREIHPGDVINILTVRMVYDGNSLSFFNAENALLIRQVEKESNQIKQAEKKTIIFERSVRLKDSIEPETIVIPNPPSVGEKPKIDYLTPGNGGNMNTMSRTVVDDAHTAAAKTLQEMCALLD